MKKSAAVYKYYGGLLLFALVFSIILGPLLKNYPEIIDLIIGVPLLIFFILAPFGLFYSIKSIKRKEGSRKNRWLYLVGHAFFTLVVLYLAGIIIMDFFQVFS